MVQSIVAENVDRVIYRAMSLAALTWVDQRVTHREAESGSAWPLQRCHAAGLA